MSMPPAPSGARAVEVVRLLRERAESVAVAESLTGGLVQAALTGVPGSSAVFVGGIVAYATGLKQRLLDVPEDLLARLGAVAGPTAEQMALGVARRCGADWGLATTGVAGPDPQEGHPPGTVFVAVAHVGPGDASAGTARVEQLALEGDRVAVRAGTVDAVLGLFLTVLRENPECGGGARC